MCVCVCVCYMSNAFFFFLLQKLDAWSFTFHIYKTIFKKKKRKKLNYIYYP